MSHRIKISFSVGKETNQQRCKRLAFILAELANEGIQIEVDWRTDFQWYFDHPDFQENMKSLDEDINRFKDNFPNWVTGFIPLFESYIKWKNTPDTLQQKYVLDDIQRVLENGIDLIKEQFSYIQFYAETDNAWFEYRLGYTED